MSDSSNRPLWHRTSWKCVWITEIRLTGNPSNTVDSRLMMTLDILLEIRVNHWVSVLHHKVIGHHSFTFRSPAGLVCARSLKASQQLAHLYAARWQRLPCKEPTAHREQQSASYPEYSQRNTLSTSQPSRAQGFSILLQEPFVGRGGNRSSNPVITTSTRSTTWAAAAYSM